MAARQAARLKTLQEQQQIAQKKIELQKQRQGLVQKQIEQQKVSAHFPPAPSVVNAYFVHYLLLLR